MNRGKRILTDLNLQYSKWFVSYRQIVMIFLEMIFLFSILSPLRNVSQFTGISISPYIFPFITSDLYLNMILFFGIILIFCDAPFNDKLSLHRISLLGKRKWLFHQTLYVFFTSLLYFLFIFLASVLPLMNNILLTADWGTVLFSLSEKGLSHNFNIALEFKYFIMLNYKPISAMIHTLFLSVGIGALYGMILMACNLISKKRIVGISLTIILNILPYFSLLIFGPKLLWFSFSSWNNLAMLSTSLGQITPSIGYVYSALIILNIVIYFFLYFWINRQDIDRLSKI